MRRRALAVRGRVAGGILLGLLSLLPARPASPAPATGTSPGAGAAEKLAFVDRAGGIAIYSRGQVRQVAPGPALADAVAWSPAGDRLAYIGRVGLYGDEPIAIHLLGAEGSPKKTLLLGHSAKAGAIDGSIHVIEWLAWPTAGELDLEGNVGPDLDLLQVIDVAASRVVASGSGRDFARARRSGRWAAVGWTFHFAPPKVRDHGWIQVDGRQAYPAVGEERASGRMVPPMLWSPDERSLAFLEERRGGYTVVLWQQDAEVRRILLPAPDRWTALGWSHDGRRLLLETKAGYVGVDVRSGRRVELAEPAAAEAAFPGLAVARRHREIERSLHAQGAAWWPPEASPRPPEAAGPAAG